MIFFSYDFWKPLQTKPLGSGHMYVLKKFSFFNSIEISYLKQRFGKLK